MFLVNHEPWSLLDRFHQQLGNLSYSDSDSYYSNTSTGHWCPAVDIKEEKDRFLIIADVPGVNPTDIEIMICLLYTSPSPRDRQKSRMPSSA